jgi:hypothetical protein
MLFKSRGGSGYVKNVNLHDFISRGTKSGLQFNPVSMKIRAPWCNRHLSNFFISPGQKWSAIRETVSCLVTSRLR